MKYEPMYIYYGSVPNKYGFPIGIPLAIYNREDFKKYVHMDPVTGLPC